MPASRFTLDYAASGPYLINKVSSSHFFHTGKLVLPICGDPNYPARKATTRSVQVSSPYGFKVVSFHLARVRAQPRIPTPYTQDRNLEFLGGVLHTPAPTILTDGFSYIWEVSGTYWYRCVKPIWVREGFVVGATTIDNTPGAQNVIRGNQFVPAIPPPQAVQNVVR